MTCTDHIFSWRYEVTIEWILELVWLVLFKKSVQYQLPTNKRRWPVQVSLTYQMLDFSDIKISFDIDLEKKLKTWNITRMMMGIFFTSTHPSWIVKDCLFKIKAPLVLVWWFLWNPSNFDWAIIIRLVQLKIHVRH